MPFEIIPASSRLEREHATDLRRSVLCGELHWPQSLISEISAQEQETLLASLGPKPVGTGRAFSDGTRWELDCVAVLPAFRRKGLGRQLLQRLQAHAQGHGATALGLWSPPESRPFFESLGYAEAVSAKARQGLIALEKKLA